MKLDLKEYCEKCPEFEPEINRLSNGNEVIFMEIYCKHSPRCNAIERYLEKRMDKKESTVQKLINDFLTEQPIEVKHCGNCKHFYPNRVRIESACYGCIGTKSKKGWEPIEEGAKDER